MNLLIAIIIVLGLAVGTISLAMVGEELLDKLLAWHYRRRLRRFRDEIADYRREEWLKQTRRGP